MGNVKKDADRHLFYNPGKYKQDKGSSGFCRRQSPGAGCPN